MFQLRVVAKGILYLLLLFLGITICWYVYCFEIMYSVVPELEPSQTADFKITRPNSHPITSIRVWNYQSDVLIWELEAINWRKKNFTTGEIHLGILPNGMRQKHPANEAGLEILNNGDVVVIQISYIHDHFMAPGRGADTILLQCNQGQLSLVRKMKSWEVRKPIWKSSSERDRQKQALRIEIMQTSKFMQIVRDPEKKMLEMDTVRLLMEYVKKESGEEAYFYLRQLDNFRLFDMKISNISMLSDFVQLEWIQLGRNQITDISSLQNLPKLNSLELSVNPIKEFDALGNLKSMRFLKLNHTGIKDLSVLSNLKKLEHLSINGNELDDATDLSCLANLKIEQLHISQNKLRTGVQLKHLQHLEILHIEQNLLESFEFIKWLPWIRMLYISHNKTSDLGPVIEHFKRGEFKSPTVYFYDNKPLPEEQLRELKKYAVVVSGRMEPNLKFTH